jgi:hypothetical protein
MQACRDRDPAEIKSENNFMATRLAVPFPIFRHAVQVAWCMSWVRPAVSSPSKLAVRSGLSLFHIYLFKT